MDPVTHLDAKAQAAHPVMFFHRDIDDVGLGGRHLGGNPAERAASGRDIQLQSDREYSGNVLGPAYVDEAVCITALLAQRGRATAAMQGEAVATPQVTNQAITGNRVAAGGVGN